MIAYLFKRILFFIPTLLVISLLAFGLSHLAPGDPVLLYLDGVGNDNIKQIQIQERIYKETKKKLGLDQPPFYFAVRPQAFPDTLYKLMTKREVETAKSLIVQTGDWSKVDVYQKALQTLYRKSILLPDSLGTEALVPIRRRLKDLQYQTDTSLIAKRFSIHTKELTAAGLKTAFEPEQTNFQSAFAGLKAVPNTKALRRPRFVWYGFNNQYHNWIKGFFTGDMGYSFQDGYPVRQKIGSALRWTIYMSGFALLIAYGASIFIGVFMAINKGKRWDKLTSLILFMLYSLPSFWIATLLLLFFTTPEFGLQFFSITEISDISKEDPFWERFFVTAKHMVLPVFCLAYVPLAAISLQVRGGMLEVMDQDYIRTAYAKGLSKRKVIWQHAFRNALFPIITILGGLIPTTIAGSVVIEYIFNIPGMGRL
ncbi:MAG: ABC transporter permease, partial [Bacteroidota bacterium]